MKTHELAKALSTLAKVLRSFPNQDLQGFVEVVDVARTAPRSDIGVSLSTLAAFSNFSKSDWEKVIHEFDLPIEVRPRDAGRDIMGKILSYLAENQSERARIARKSGDISSSNSELSNALSFLLSNG